jgi:DNA-binding GntR family transcriptional regulator
LPRAEDSGCDHGLRRQRIVQAVLTDVFEGRFEAGRRLVTQELAERFGVSHTPIREALVALEGIGIIDLLPNRGAVVRRVSAREVREICQVRRALESEAARQACGRIDRGVLGELAAEFDALHAGAAGGDAQVVARAAIADSRLHDTVAQACGNTFLANELNRLKLLFRAFRDVSYHRDEARFVPLRLADETREHRAIVAALQAEDRKGAGRAMSRHILSAVAHWIRTLPDPDPDPRRPDPPGPRSNHDGRSRFGLPEPETEPEPETGERRP